MNFRLTACACSNKFCKNYKVNKKITDKLDIKTNSLNHFGTLNKKGGVLYAYRCLQSNTTDLRNTAIAKQAVANVPDVREDLVSSLKQQIDNDTYEVDADDFAGKLLEKYGGLF